MINSCGEIFHDVCSILPVDGIDAPCISLHFRICALALRSLFMKSRRGRCAKLSTFEVKGNREMHPTLFLAQDEQPTLPRVNWDLVVDLELPFGLKVLGSWSPQSGFRRIHTESFPVDGQRALDSLVIPTRQCDEYLASLHISGRKNIRIVRLDRALR